MRRKIDTYDLAHKMSKYINTYRGEVFTRESLILFLQEKCELGNASDYIALLRKDNIISFSKSERLYTIIKQEPVFWKRFERIIETYQKRNALYIKCSNEKKKAEKKEADLQKQLSNISCTIPDVEISYTIC